MNTRVQRGDSATGRSLKPYVAIVALAVVAGVVLFSLVERWGSGPAWEDPDVGGVIDGGGRVVIGRPSAGPTTKTRTDSAPPTSSYKPEEFTFYKSLGSPAIPAPKLDTRPTTSPPPPSGAAPKIERPERSQRAPVIRKSYTVQVGSFQDRKAAEQLAARLRRRHQMVSVSRVVLPNAGVRYRVRVGVFKTREDARDLADLLKTTEKVSPFVALVATDPPR
ncbi:MAG: SPOR domain-containing protein [Nitrospirae bacterium]|nr:SPOR domain-containing protein [Nitrospirota bacterium]